MAELLLNVEHLSKSYTHERGLFDAIRGRHAPPTTRPALDDVSLSLHVGETLGIVGESGSGKSTLARCLTLLEQPDGGRVLLDGVDLTRLRGRELRDQRRRIQVVFQDPYSSLNPRLSVRDAIGEVLIVHRLGPRSEVQTRTVKLLDQVGLSERALDRFPSEFSGGQRQRICIARALAAEPALLIADEAVSALDVSIQAQILNLFVDLREQLGLAMLFISHNLHVVRHVAPHVAVMFGGRIVELVPETMRLEDAEHPYTRSLYAAAPRLRATGPALQEMVAADLAARLPVVGCPFRDRCPRAFDRCAMEDPALLDVGPGHLVACHAVAQSHASEHPAQTSNPIYRRTV